MLDDDVATRRLDDQLRRERFAVDIVNSVNSEAVGRTKSRAPVCDVIVLDSAFRGQDAISICRDLRRRGIATPIVTLAATDSPQQRTAALTAGADDCLTKPFAFPEFLARIHAVSRRAGAARAGVLRVADLTLDARSRRAIRGRRILTLTRTEYAILEILMRHPGELVARGALHRALWGPRTRSISNRLDVHIANLRRKIARAGESPLIRTIWGCGFLIG